ncbi:MAG TPA: UDP-N-acetylmuramoyl-tripeptide--D-alanyl-D-alanine ligase [Marmoricola sp.]
MRLDEIATLLGGVVDGPGDAAGVLVTGPAFLDSRAPEPGGLFAAFAGEHTDGHEFAGAAVAGGAAAVLGSRATGVPTVVVADVGAALQELARVVLARLRGSGSLQVIALTGSSGKTSTKDLLARVLEAAAPTVATHGSFNNELGLPLTVLRAVPQTRHLVLEMGSRGIGHLRALTAIARPDLSMVLNVGTAHIGEFGSQANIALAKGELVEALSAEGTAVLNADDPLVRAMASRTDARLITFGTAGDATVRIADVRLDDLGRPSFTVTVGGESVEIAMQLLGAHQALNAAAVVAAATSSGLALAAVAEQLASVRALSPWRMEVHERPDGAVVINDAYNANPDSMRAALDTLAGIGERTGRRTVAVLGEMRELGGTSATAHAEMGRYLDELGIDVSVVIGADAAAIDAKSTRHVDSVAEAVAWLGNNVQRNDVVLIKASRGARLERVAYALLDETARTSPDGRPQGARQ